MRCENIDRMAPLFAGPPVLCGHRGMGVGTVLGHAENTLASFLAAAEARAARGSRSTCA